MSEHSDAKRVCCLSAAPQSGSTEPRVDRENRVIRGVALAHVGELAGHNLWWDEVASHQAVKLAPANGVPVRWTHPSPICGDDGMGKQIGRIRDLEVTSDGTVIGNLFLYRKATGRRAEMIEEVLNLAEEDPKVFGLSFVAYLDMKEMQKFIEEHSTDDSGFSSPDIRNKKNLPHVRLERVDWCDVVNEPAANPDGLFASRREVVERLLDYVVLGKPCGLEEARLALSSLGVAPKAFRDFVNEYMRSRGVMIQKVDLRAISYESAHPNGTPKASESEPWDGPGEVAKASVEDLKVMCAWVGGDGSKKGDYKFPHHKAAKPHNVVWRGVANAAARLPQAKIPAGDVPGVKRHLARHYQEFGKTPPWESSADLWDSYEELASADNVSTTELCECLLSLGFTDEAMAMMLEELESLELAVKQSSKAYHAGSFGSEGPGCDNAESQQCDDAEHNGEGSASAPEGQLELPFVEPASVPSAASSDGFSDGDSSGDSSKIVNADNTDNIEAGQPMDSIMEEIDEAFRRFMLKNFGRIV
ncbi:MAG: hypothetical protein KatS3mg054_0108 [Chloroflexus sp.]|nr:MAG: hypothetical protein KatS3mg054_0108 [Chloroflexus sp.]